MRLPRRYTAKALPSRIVPVVSQRVPVPAPVPVGTTCTRVVTSRVSLRGAGGPSFTAVTSGLSTQLNSRQPLSRPPCGPSRARRVARPPGNPAHEATTATVKPLAHHTTHAHAQRLGMRAPTFNPPLRSAFAVLTLYVVVCRHLLQWTKESNWVHADIRHLTVASVSLERTHSFSATSRLRSRVFEARFRQACQINGRTPLPSTL